MTLVSQEQFSLQNISNLSKNNCLCICNIMCACFHVLRNTLSLNVKPFDIYNVCAFV